MIGDDDNVDVAETLFVLLCLLQQGESGDWFEVLKMYALS